MVGRLILSHDSNVMRFGSGVDIQFSYDLARVRLGQDGKNCHSSMVQVDSLCCLLYVG